MMRCDAMDQLEPDPRLLPVSVSNVRDQMIAPMQTLLVDMSNSINTFQGCRHHVNWQAESFVPDQDGERTNGSRNIKQRGVVLLLR